MNDSSETNKMPQTSGQVAGQLEHSNNDQFDQPKTIDMPPIQQSSPELSVPSTLPNAQHHQLQQQLYQQTYNVHTNQSETINPDEPENSSTSVNMTNAISNNPNISHQQPPSQLIQSPSIKPLLTNDDGGPEGHQAIQIDNIQAKQQQYQQPLQSQTTPQKAVVTKVRLADELNIFDWFKTDIIGQIAEKAKSSVDSVITTLDPGMKEYLYSGGNVNILVENDSNYLVGPIRDAFQSVFGRATVLASNFPEKIDGTHIYPIKTAFGFSEAVTVAREKIRRLRLDTSNVPQNQVIIAVQPSIVSVPSKLDSANHDVSGDTFVLPKWFFTYCMLIEDPVLSTTISSYSQLIPLEEDIVDLARASDFPDGFNEKHLGFSQSIHDLMTSKMQLSSKTDLDTEYDCVWLQEWAGQQEYQVIQQLGLTLANFYRKKWNECMN